MKKVFISKEDLKDLYENKKLTTYQIASKIKCCQATVWKLLIKYEIKRRKSNELRSFVPTKEELIKLYINEQLSTWKIEERYGYSRGTVHKKLKEYGIGTRNLADSHILFPRKDFSGDLIEKAYLIGFKLGDLGVRKIHQNSKTICVASGSTIKEQIDLIQKMFSNYGKIWIKKAKDNRINIQINLNMTFSFLLSKDFPKWVKKDKESFFSFLAGYTDAEGTISLSRNMAYYSLSTCDNFLLEKIKDNLNRFRIKCNNLVINRRKGKTTFNKYKFNFDYWTLRIHKKEDLLKLFLALKPYIKHELKVKSLNTAIENIKTRNEKYGKKQVLYHDSN